MERDFIVPEKLATYFKSKHDLYRLLSIDSKQLIQNNYLENYYLPSLRKWTMEFLRQKEGWAQTN